MPYVYDPLLEEEKNPQQQGQQAPMTGGGETFSGGAGGPAPSAPQQQKGTNRQGSGFVGLDQYMAANKGSQFGNQLTGKVADTVNTAKNQLTQGAQDFTNASNQGTTHWGDVGDEFKGIVDRAGKDTTDAQTQRAKQLESTAYTGPQSFYGTAGANQALGGIDKAKQQAGALQSDGGRFALLDQYFGRPTYSLGQKTLDNALVSNQVGVPAKSQALLNRTNQISEDAKQTGQGLENLVTSNRQAAADTAKNATDYAQGALGNFQTDLDKRYADFNTQNDTYNQSMRDMAGHLDPNAAVRDQGDVYSLLGLSNNQNLYGLNDFSKYLQDPTQVSESQFASPEEAARYRALGDIASDNFQLPIDASQAGTAGTGRLTADKGGIQQALTQRHTAADQQTGNILQSGLARINQNSSLMDPKARVDDAMASLKPALDEFEKTYGYRPEITPEMLWQGPLDYNQAPQSGGGLVSPPGGRTI